MSSTVASIFLIFYQVQDLDTGKQLVYYWLYLLALRDLFNIKVQATLNNQRVETLDRFGGAVARWLVGY